MLNKKLLGLATMMPTLALAHESHVVAGVSHSIMHGLTHPLLGMDHLIAALAVGVWAVRGDRQSAWMAPVVFLLSIFIGGVLGVSGFQVPFVEMGITASLVFFGFMLVSNVRVSKPTSLGFIGLFASFHGLAHGHEMTITLSALIYLVGITISTLVLFVSAKVLAQQGIRQFGDAMLRVVGLVVAVSGGVLAFLG